MVEEQLLQAETSQAVPLEALAPVELQVVVEVSPCLCYWNEDHHHKRPVNANVLLREKPIGSDLGVCQQMMKLHASEELECRRLWKSLIQENFRFDQWAASDSS